MKESETSGEASVFELKGSVLTVMVLYIREIDPELLYPQLKKKIGPARSFFNNAPILVDLKAVPEEEQMRLDFLVLTTFLRGLGLVPVGVRAVADTVAQRVLDAGLGVLPPTKNEKNVATPEEESLVEHAIEPIPDPPAEPEAEPEPEVKAVPTMVIRLPVRSGQQVVAQDGDLVILSSVNAGAEVVASGNIHVYGALRGRAMAGVHGNADARVFCLQCNPELVAVADAYVVNELLENRVLNRCVMISRGKSGLEFEVLGSFDPHRG
ncbi:MAG: septum site-determining protein MinC [Desulfobulbus sp.]|nr:septum site-determining protein MinC [Desulfobulbus sp.]